MARKAALLFLIVFLTRLPFLGPGFGSDPDAWRIAGAARDIARTGHYTASRFPGAPVVEIADSVLLRFGERALPVAGALWGAIACVAFYVALCRLGVRGCFWAALALAFTPVFWIHTTDAMDYSWALGLAMISLACAVHGRALLAGAALGLAVGCRIPTVVLIVPIAILLEGRAHARFLIATAVFGALALAPSYLTYGTRFLSAYEFGRVPWIYVVKGATRDVWGNIGTPLVGLAVLLALLTFRREPKREILAFLSAVILVGATYLRLPHDGAYLLPMVPFVFLFLSRMLPRSGMALLAMGLALSALFFGIVERQHLPHPSRFSIPITLSDESLTLDFARGPLLGERAQRTFDIGQRDKTVKWLATLSSTDIVALYEDLPAVQWVIPSGSPGYPTLVHLLDRDAFERAQREGRKIYWTAASGEAEWQIYHTGPFVPRF